MLILSINKKCNPSTFYYGHVIYDHLRKFFFRPVCYYLREKKFILRKKKLENMFEYTDLIVKIFPEILVEISLNR